jgi:hypothetical protein
MKQATARYTTEAHLRTLCPPTPPHSQLHARSTHAARTHARARCVQALDEITPLETKKAKIERDLHCGAEGKDISEFQNLNSLCGV